MAKIAKLTAERKAAIDKRLADMPKNNRFTYRKAVLKGGLRACINAQCCECCGYQRIEVHLCTDLGCPLYAVRPYQDLSTKAHKDSDVPADGLRVQRRERQGTQSDFV
jgi:hypothetical protein